MGDPAFVDDFTMARPHDEAIGDQLPQTRCPVSAPHTAIENQ